MKCSIIKQLVLEPHHPNERILKAIHPITFQKINSIVLRKSKKGCEVKSLLPCKSPLLFLCERQDCSFDLTVRCHLDGESFDAFNTVLRVCESRSRSVHTLYINTYLYKVPMNQMYPQLVNLYLTDCVLDQSYLSHLAEASAKGRFPKLSTLDISNNSFTGGHICVLLRSTFPSLHTLILNRCNLQISDVHSLQQARREARLPKLGYLDVSSNHSVHFGNVVSNVLLFERGMSTLVVRSCWLNSNDMCAARNNTFLPELTALDMSENIICGEGLSALMSHNFPQLQILVLRRCGLTSDDLHSLVEANNQGRLPELRHLDISENNIHWESKGISGMFGELTVFPSLINLNLCDCHLMLQDLCCLTQAKLDGKLPRIKHLDISLNGLSDHVGILSRDPLHTA